MWGLTLKIYNNKVLVPKLHAVQGSFHKHLYFQYFQS
jgi:hypothetical protein